MQIASQTTIITLTAALQRQQGKPEDLVPSEFREKITNNQELNPERSYLSRMRVKY